MVKKGKKRDEMKKKKGKTKKKILIIFLIIIAILGIIFAKRVYELDGNWIAALMGHNKETIENLDKINVLLMGESEGLSDTMIICSYNPKTQEASLLSIPRDTFVGTNINNANSSDKLNSVYRVGEKFEKTLKVINRIIRIRYRILYFNRYKSINRSCR